VGEGEDGCDAGDRTQGARHARGGGRVAGRWSRGQSSSGGDWCQTPVPSGNCAIESAAADGISGA